MSNRAQLPALAALALFAVSSCGLFDEAQTDGELCRDDDECSTGVCTSASLCSHSRCKCPSGNCAPGGEQSSDCRDGWVCVGYDSLFDPVKEFFGGKPNTRDGYCQPSCAAGCPEHYECEGDLCKPDSSWAAPQATIVWSGASSGELHGRDQLTTVVVEGGSTITLSGSATSPAEAEIVSLTWMTSSPGSDPVTLEQPSIEITVPPAAASYRSVTLDAVDDRHRSATLTVIFEACTGAGEACGYQGSGCCNGCDPQTDTCS